ncbi:hypothetical protein [Cohnella nanjingensis]|uniref:Uncharacterized protein n=1 Tax=Cohnella nanjingensis TaxID=1387779 RepID=A0A7X0RM09_9BACL|nr:hypothetical protein [Cohnella nanjingensis]MBB6669763.1 hypothetical protein [Cohnella nanjingensis]
MDQAYLTGIEIFEFAGTGAEGQALPRRRGVLKLSCGADAGWSGCILSEGNVPFDLIRWAAYLNQLRRVPLHLVGELAYQERERWGPARASLVEEASRALQARMQPAATIRLVAAGASTASSVAWAGEREWLAAAPSTAWVGKAEWQAELLAARTGKAERQAELLAARAGKAAWQAASIAIDTLPALGVPLDDETLFRTCRAYYSVII